MSFFEKNKKYEKYIMILYFIVDFFMIYGFANLIIYTLKSGVNFGSIASSLLMLLVFLLPSISFLYSSMKDFLEDNTNKFTSIVVSAFIIILFTIILVFQHISTNTINDLKQEINNKEYIINILTEQNNKLLNEQANNKDIELNTSSSKLEKEENNDIVPIKEEEKSDIVYITNTGNKYHRAGCSYLKSSNSISKEDAINRGYNPCLRCNP